MNIKKQLREKCKRNRMSSIIKLYTSFFKSIKGFFFKVTYQVLLYFPPQWKLSMQSPNTTN